MTKLSQRLSLLALLALALSASPARHSSAEVPRLAPFFTESAAWANLPPAARAAFQRFVARHPHYRDHREKCLKIIGILETNDRNDPLWWELLYEGVYQNALYLDSIESSEPRPAPPPVAER